MFFRLHKQLKHCIQRKKARIKDITDAAARAAARHDTRALYQAIRTRAVRFGALVGSCWMQNRSFNALNNIFDRSFKLQMFIWCPPHAHRLCSLKMNLYNN